MKEPCNHTAYQSHLRAAECAECLRAENARLAAALKDLDVLVQYQGKDGHRDWQSAGAWLMPGDVIAVIRLP